MTGIGAGRIAELRRDFDRVLHVLERCQVVDKQLHVPTEEFTRRQQVTGQALLAGGLDVGFVFSDEHYDGDVPYLGGNTNVTIEQVAGVIGPTGFHVIAGLEGGYVAEQLAPRAGAVVHKVELLQLADEKYPVRAERMEDVLTQAAGKTVRRIGLLTPRQVVPGGIVRYLEGLVGRENVVDAQALYYRGRSSRSKIPPASPRPSGTGSIS